MAWTDFAETFTKNAEKLIQSVRSYTAGPEKTRRPAIADLNKLSIPGQGVIDVQKPKTELTTPPVYDQTELAAITEGLRQRAAERLTHNELHKQLYIEQIVGKALVLANQTDRPKLEAPVDDDWKATFFDNCSKVSNEEMQSLWAKILAGEVNQPGSFSKQTLDILKSMDKDDAELFRRLGSAVWYYSALRDPTPLLDFQDMNTAGFHARNIPTLESLGLVKQIFPGISNQIHKELLLFYFDRGFHCVVEPPQQWNVPTNIILTRSGKELFEVCGAKPDDKMMTRAIEAVRKSGFPIVEVQVIKKGETWYEVGPLPRKAEGV